MITALYYQILKVKSFPKKADINPKNASLNILNESAIIKVVTEINKYKGELK